jgi:tetratricopeptide (TPR) repeat protein
MPVIGRINALAEDSAESNHELGYALLKRGEIVGAVAALRKAVEVRPDSVNAWIHLGNAHAAAREYEAGAAAYRRALELRPGYAEVHSNLGHALWKAGRLDEAIAECARAIELRPDYFAACTNLGNILLDAGRMGESIGAHRRALMLAPESPPAHFNLGVALLENGEFQEGWLHYEWRWRILKPFIPEPQFSQTMWDGRELGGRRILLHPEGGHGDTIHFARFAPLIAARGGTVVLACQKELFGLLKTLDGVSELVAWGDGLPAFDVHAPMISLPRLLQTTLQNIPASGPYLRCDPSRVDFWKRKMPAKDGRLNVGLAWAGSPAHLNNLQRSIPIGTFAPLSKVQRARFFSLQKGEASGEARSSPFPIIDWTADLHDFAETAALISQLDLVICVDTAVAHLAGALGKRTWILLPSAPEWRWMRGREDSPWYPTVRLFRQSTAGDWAEPICKMTEALGGLAQTK